MKAPGCGSRLQRGSALHASPYHRRNKISAHAWRFGTCGQLQNSAGYNMNARTNCVKRLIKFRAADGVVVTLSSPLLDKRHRLISYQEMFQGTIDGASASERGRRAVPGRRTHHSAPQRGIGARRHPHLGSHHRRRRRHDQLRGKGALMSPDRLVCTPAAARAY